MDILDFRKLGKVKHFNLSKYCIVCRKQFNTPEKKIFHLKNVRPFVKCVNCTRYFIGDRCSCTDIKTVSPLMRCGICDERVETSTIKSHKCFHEIQHTPNCISCTQCRTVFDSLEGLAHHQNDVASYPYRCTKCKNHFSSRSPCACNDSKNKFCSFCLKQWSRINNKASHECFHKFGWNGVEREMIQCILCRGKMPRVMVEQHMKSHEFKVECDSCHKYILKSKIDNHLSKHIKVPTKRIRKYEKRSKYNCPSCNTYYPTVAEYYRHRRSVHKKGYVCEICGKTVKKMGQHVLSHSGEKPYACAICGKTFKLSHTFKRHRLVHTNEFSHLCTVCGKSYKTSFSLKVHKRSHDEVKPFECSICLKTFTTKQWRDNHIKSHT